MNEIFRELGADYIIEGGQTMNPSTEDMLNAIDQVNAEHILFFRIIRILYLLQIRQRHLTEDKDIIVIPTKTVPQGITAIINICRMQDDECRAMLEEIQNVKTGQVTYAVRDTHIDDKEIHEGDIMGIETVESLQSDKSVEETTKDMLAQLVDEDSELISLYYGQMYQEEMQRTLQRRLKIYIRM